MDAHRRYAPALLRKRGRILAGREDAEDIVQTLFIDPIRSGRTELGALSEEVPS